MNTKFYSLAKRGGGQIVFCVTLIFSTLFLSCNKDVSETSIFKNETPEQRIERRISDLKLSGKTLIVEQSSLEEINKLMREAGFPEYTEKDVRTTIQNRTIYDCSVWVLLGDYNGNGILSAADLVGAKSYQCANVGCDGTINLGTGSYPTAVYDFAYLSYLETGYDWHLFNNDDILAGQRRILGLIACN